MNMCFKSVILIVNSISFVSVIVKQFVKMNKVLLWVELVVEVLVYTLMLLHGLIIFGKTLF